MHDGSESDRRIGSNDSESEIGERALRPTEHEIEQKSRQILTKEGALESFESRQTRQVMWTVK